MKKLYTVSREGEDDSSLELLSKEEAYKRSVGILRRDITEHLISDEMKSIVSSRKVFLEVAVFVECDNCSGVGTTDTLGMYECSCCDGTGKELI